MSHSETQMHTDELAHWGPTFARLALGVPILVAGIGKLFAVGPKPFGIGGFSGFLASNGVPLPTVFAWLVGITEFICGTLLLLGVLVRVAGILVSVIMLSATVIVHLPNGYPTADGGFELTLALFFIAISLVVAGPGRLSVEHDVLERELVPLPASLSGE